MFTDNDTALLVRKNGPNWVFAGDGEYNCLMHVTRYGTQYAIVVENCPFKPIWIARGFYNSDGSRAWCTYENIIGALFIDFSNGARWLFP